MTVILVQCYAILGCAIKSIDYGLTLQQIYNQKTIATTHMPIIRRNES